MASNHAQGNPRALFAERLDELHRLAGSPNLDDVADTARRVGAALATRTARVQGGTPASNTNLRQITDKRISAWKTGANVPRSFSLILPVSQVLIGEAKKRGSDQRRSGGLYDVKEWEQWWREASSSRASIGHGVDAQRKRARTSTALDTRVAYFYLLGYNLAAYKRYYSYCEDYQGESELETQAAVYYLAEVRDSYKDTLEALVRESDLAISEILRSDFDPTMDGINRLEGRFPAADYVKRQFGHSLYRAFRWGDYIGGEIGFCHELVRHSQRKENVIFVFDLKLEQFDGELGDLPKQVAALINRRTLETIANRLRQARGRDGERISSAVEEFFGLYEKVTQYYEMMKA